ncbi:unnamed protein product [Amoebophrya sp. A120]|nr:unnamed protein product [Amoebophrya sp. A120]|eukprot:GSA120T00021447001.1
MKPVCRLVRRNKAFCFSSHTTKPVDCCSTPALLQNPKRGPVRARTFFTTTRLKSSLLRTSPMPKFSNALELVQSLAQPPPEEVLESRNPRSGEVLQSFAEMTDGEVDQVLTELAKPFATSALPSNKAKSWSSFETLPLRCKLAEQVGQILLEEQTALATLIHNEMGKAMPEAEAEVRKSAGLCLYYANNAEAFLQPVITADAASDIKPTIPGVKKSYYVYEPLGVILSVMPWNFPVWQVIRMAIPVLVGGNTVVLKHAPNVLGSALKCEEIFAKAAERVFGEEGRQVPCIFRALRVQAAKTTDILSHPVVRGVSLTGSERAGRSVAMQAGALLKKCVVELGGNDGYVLLKDADIDCAVDQIVAGRLVNNGQSCIGPKRIICEGETVKKQVEEKLVQKLSEVSTTARVMVHSKAKEGVALQVKEAVEKHGANCIYPVGGVVDSTTSTEGVGISASFADPIVLTNVPAHFDTEIFGPVFSILTAAESEQQAIQMHNQTSFGLGGAVFSKNEKHAEALAGEALSTGMCWVNAFVKSDASLPFGGVRNSGLGRECGPHGVLEFQNIKTICIADHV